MHLKIIYLLLAMFLVFAAIAESASAGPLTWPIGCVPGVSCTGNSFLMGYPDIRNQGKAFDCSPPGYTGHTGTDIVVSSAEDRIPVLAADDGEVVLVSGGRFDRCPNDAEPDCQPLWQARSRSAAGAPPLFVDPGPTCTATDGCFAWGFDAGNMVLIRHQEASQVYYTLYAHLGRGSIAVTSGQQVKRGEKIAEVASSGASLVPHLHFGVFRKTQTANELVDPWTGDCSPKGDNSLWQYDPPYTASISVVKGGSGDGIITCTRGGSTCSYPDSIVPGTTITLKATPYYGSSFVGWEGACSGMTNTCTIVVAAATRVTAVFQDLKAPVNAVFIPPTFANILNLPGTVTAIPSPVAADR